MPLVPLVLLLLLVPLMVALTPLTLVLRYRAGTARRPARRWLAAINVFGLALSVLLFLVGAAIATFWVPRALSYSLLGLLGGALLGLLGLRWARWEPSLESVHYTPNRWLVLGLTLLVTGRIAYGLWRAWSVWQSPPPDESWLAAAGAAGSLAVGAVVLGYAFVFWAGVWHRAGPRSH